MCGRREEGKEEERKRQEGQREREHQSKRKRNKKKRRKTRRRKRVEDEGKRKKINECKSELTVQSTELLGSLGCSPDPDIAVVD